MIKKSIVLLILMLGFSFSSCDEDDLESLLPAIDINVDETQKIDVFVDKTDGDWVDFTSTMDLSIANNDTDKYLNKIKKVKINRLRYKVFSFNGDPNGEVQGTFSADNGQTLQNNFVVQNAFANGIEYEVKDTAELNRIANALKSKHTVQITYSGKALCDQQAMNFVIEVRLEGVVTVDP